MFVVSPIIVSNVIYWIPFTDKKIVSELVFWAPLILTFFIGAGWIGSYIAYNIKILVEPSKYLITQLVENKRDLRTFLVTLLKRTLRVIKK